ncbi:hypothetical protein [Aequorivita antarctica]|uniref:Uncharacterized protein n=1 Tax=Aequorivita antarctica TaxID=153266 RepID=A0A5C6YV94_9FLAO|nr:hypothetical protein [Aequorivita antarctica]TXD71262.1 hypothetical protein ESU54_17460 [Aequorivita antarctica]
MAVFLYQIGIFLAIIIASSFGKKARNTAVILISIFTLLQVFMSWLLLLQFVTIFIAYIISNSFADKKTTNKIVSKSPNKKISDFRDRNQELEYAQLDRLHTANILTSIKAPSKPVEPTNPDKYKPNFSSRITIIVILLVLTILLSYILPFVLLVDWIKKSSNLSDFYFFAICGALITLIQIKYHYDDNNEFKIKQEKYKVYLEKYNEKLKKYKSDLTDFENKYKSLSQIEMENARFERKMSELKGHTE